MEKSNKTKLNTGVLLAWHLVLNLRSNTLVEPAILSVIKYRLMDFGHMDEPQPIKI